MLLKRAHVLCLCVVTFTDAIDLAKRQIYPKKSRELLSKHLRKIKRAASLSIDLGTMKISKSSTLTSEDKATKKDTYFLDSNKTSEATLTTDFRKSEHFNSTKLRKDSIMTNDTISTETVNVEMKASTDSSTIKALEAGDLLDKSRLTEIPEPLTLTTDISTLTTGVNTLETTRVTISDFAATKSTKVLALPTDSSTIEASDMFSMTSDFDVTSAKEMADMSTFIMNSNLTNITERSNESTDFSVTVNTEASTTADDYTLIQSMEIIFNDSSAIHFTKRPASVAESNSSMITKASFPTEDSSSMKSNMSSPTVDPISTPALITTTKVLNLTSDSSVTETTDASTLTANASWTTDTERPILASGFSTTDSSPATIVEKSTMNTYFSTPETSEASTSTTDSGQTNIMEWSSTTTDFSADKALNTSILTSSTTMKIEGILTPTIICNSTKTTESSIMTTDISWLEPSKAPIVTSYSNLSKNTDFGSTEVSKESLLTIDSTNKKNTTNITTLSSGSSTPKTLTSSIPTSNISSRNTTEWYLMTSYISSSQTPKASTLSSEFTKTMKIPEVFTLTTEHSFSETIKLPPFTKYPNTTETTEPSTFTMNPSIAETTRKSMTKKNTTINTMKRETVMSSTIYIVIGIFILVFITIVMSVLIMACGRKFRQPGRTEFRKSVTDQTFSLPGYNSDRFGTITPLSKVRRPRTVQELEALELP